MSRLMTLDDRKKVSLDILKKIAEICDQNEIPYFLGYGTLLGAIRHNGYIPWDDDVDLCVYMADYERLLDKIEEDGTYDALSYSRKNGWDVHFAKISNRDTAIKELNKEEFEDRGVAVDIFPLANYVSDAWRKKTRKYIIFLHLYRMDVSGKGIKPFVKRATQVLLKTFITEERVFERFCSIVNTEGEYEYMIALPGLTERSKFKKAWFEKDTHIFEDAVFSIPKYYDKVLTHHYGNYMTVPPEEERNTVHDVEAYWRE